MVSEISVKYWLPVKYSRNTPADIIATAAANDDTNPMHAMNTAVLVRPKTIIPLRAPAGLPVRTTHITLFANG